MAYVIIPRHDTVAALSTLNRIYAEGELILEEQLDGTYKLKVGNGVQTYNLLAYIGGVGGGGSNAIGSIVVSGQSTIVADTTSDALTVVVGAGLTATTNATTDTLTVSPLYGTTAGTICQGDDSRLSGSSTPLNHATTHGAGGTDTIKLDALAAPDDVTTLNASASAHGLLPKLSNNATHTLSGTGAWVTNSSVTLKSFGAVGDGTTNDTAAVISALTSNSRVYVTPGLYLIDPITITGVDSLALTGTGKGNACRFKLRTNGTMLTFSGCTNIEIKNILVFDESNFTNGLGIDWILGSSGRIYECTFYGFKTNAVRFLGTALAPLSSFVVRDCWFLSNGQDSASAQLYLYHANDFSITGNSIGSFFPVPAWPGIGAKLEESKNGTFVDNMMWLNTLGCQIINGHFNRIICNRFEESRQTGVSIVGSQYMTFTNNWINDNSTSTINTYDGCQFYNVGESIIANNIVYAWAQPTRIHRNSYSFEASCTNNTIVNNKSLFAGTAHAAVSSGSAGNKFDGDFSFGSSAAIAAATTRYLGPAGASVTVSSAALVSCRSVYVRLVAALDVAPGGAQTVQFTLMLDGAATSLVCTISAGSFGASAVGYVYAGAESSVCVRVVYSATAATSTPRCVLQGMNL